AARVCLAWSDAAAKPCAARSPTVRCKCRLPERALAAHGASAALANPMLNETIRVRVSISFSRVGCCDGAEHFHSSHEAVLPSPKCGMSGARQGKGQPAQEVSRPQPAPVGAAPLAWLPSASPAHGGARTGE